MQCKDLMSALGDYLDGQEDAPLCREFAEHLHLCDRCRIVVDNVKHTVQLFREDGSSVEMPAELRDKLHDTLRRRWNERAKKD